MTRRSPTRRDPQQRLRPATRLVHGGTLRSQFGETSEALFLTQGFVYDTMETAEARFKGDDAGLHLFALRQSDRRDVRAAHGAARRRRGRARHRQRHGGGHRRAHGPAQGRRPRRRGAGAVRLLPLHRRGSAAALRRRVDPRRRHRSRRMARGDAARTPRSLFLESPTNPTLEVIDIAAVAEIAHEVGATLVVDNVFATPMLQQPAGARRRLRRLFGDQAHRRPGPLPRRRDARRRGVHRRRTSTISCARPARRCRPSTPG